MANVWNRRQRAGSGRVSRRQALRAGVGGGAMAALFLAACGDSSNESTSGVSGAEPTQGAVLREDGEPKPGGTISWRSPGTPPLDPTNNTSYQSQQLAGFVHARLLKFKTGPTPDVAYNYEIEPDLAERYEVASDGSQVTLTLRSNVKFHNKPPVNGRELTSEDVKASFERFKSSPRNNSRTALDPIASIETPDPRTVVLKMARPYAPVLNLLANPQYGWIQPKEADAGFDPAKEMIGAGPFMLEQVQPDVSLSLKKHPEYFVSGRPYVDGVTINVIPDSASLKAQFIAGRIDWATFNVEDVADLQRTNANYQEITYIPTTYQFIGTQMRSGPFQDVRVRRALSLAFDRDALADLLYQGKGKSYLSALPASMGKWWVNPETDSSPGAANFKYDPKQARDLLSAAGAENLAFRFIYTNNAYGDSFNQGAEATAGMLKEGGFQPTIVIQDYLREYVVAGGTTSGRFEGVYYGLQTPFTDPHDYFYIMTHSNSNRNGAGVRDARLDQMIQDEEQTFDEAERVKKVHEIQRYLMEQMYYIPGVVGYGYQFQQPWMRRLYYSATYGFGAETHTGAWIDKGS